MRQLEGTTAVFAVARGKIRPLRVASSPTRYAARGRPALSRAMVLANSQNNLVHELSHQAFVYISA